MATTSVMKKLMPVALPPGRARLATRPNLTGSWGHRRRSGSSLLQLWPRALQARFRAWQSRLPSVDYIGHQCRQTIVVALEPVIVDRHVLAFDVAASLRPLRNRAAGDAENRADPASNKPDHRQIRLLRARGERPHNRVPPSADMNCRLHADCHCDRPDGVMPAAISGTISRLKLEVCNLSHGAPSDRECPRVTAFGPAEPLKYIPKCREATSSFGNVGRGCYQFTDQPNLVGLLGTGDMRPRNCCDTAETGYEFSPCDANRHLPRPRWDHARSTIEGNITLRHCGPIDITPPPTISSLRCGIE